MKVGDLVDNGLDCVGIIVKLGYPKKWRYREQRSYLVYFLEDTTQNGWYGDDDLEVISESR